MRSSANIRLAHRRPTSRKQRPLHPIQQHHIHQKHQREARLQRALSNARVSRGVHRRLSLVHNPTQTFMLGVHDALVVQSNPFLPTQRREQASKSSPNTRQTNLNDYRRGRHVSFDPSQNMEQYRLSKRTPRHGTRRFY